MSLQPLSSLWHSHMLGEALFTSCLLMTSVSIGSLNLYFLTIDSIYQAVHQGCPQCWTSHMPLKLWWAETEVSFHCKPLLLLLLCSLSKLMVTLSYYQKPRRQTPTSSKWITEFWVQVFIISSCDTSLVSLLLSFILSTHSVYQFHVFCREQLSGPKIVFQWLLLALRIERESLRTVGRSSVNWLLLNLFPVSSHTGLV